MESLVNTTDIQTGTHRAVGHGAFLNLQPGRCDGDSLLSQQSCVCHISPGYNMLSVDARGANGQQQKGSSEFHFEKWWIQTQLTQWKGDWMQQRLESMYGKFPFMRRLYSKRCCSWLIGYRFSRKHATSIVILSHCRNLFCSQVSHR